ncbi:LON peptidase substrate-binding domain-containing protein [Mucisphaera sp.]|uniref:LON peptidase substrate-binding domain-containing protein n=1 Tax=Mucisphaera sp. TaxID=2913024 RepID=UPI003D0F7ED7
MPETHVDFSQPVPLFPLANCVLLPHATIRLHIFEPRYRAMVEDALNGPRLIAMAVFNDPRWKSNYADNLILHTAACLGYIVRDTQLPDGRYNILLQGLTRCRITTELEHEPYRLAHLEPLETNPTLEIDLTDTRTRLETLIADPKLGELAAIQAVRNLLNHDLPTNALIDLACLTLCEETEPRYQLLSEPNPHTRAAWLEHHLHHLRDTVTKALRSATGDTDTGIYLN